MSKEDTSNVDNYKVNEDGVHFKERAVNECPSHLVV